MPKRAAPAIRRAGTARSRPSEVGCIHIDRLRQPVAIGIICINDEDSGVVACCRDAAQRIISVNHRAIGCESWVTL